MLADRLRIVSHFPGRLRVRAARFRDAVIGAEVADGIRTEPGVITSIATTRTGSLLVEYDATKVQLPWLVQLIVRLGGLEGVAVDHDGQPIQAGGPLIRHALDRVNNSMMDATRGRIDARVALPGTLAGLGVLTLLFGRRRLPEWYDLLFWSYTMFVNFNPPQNGEPQ